MLTLFWGSERLIWYQISRSIWFVSCVAKVLNHDVSIDNRVDLCCDCFGFIFLTSNFKKYEVLMRCLYP